MRRGSAPAAVASGGALRRRPRRVVALGGGTGLPAVLRGLRDTAVVHGTELTAVVAVSDDGGSSGRLRRSLGMPPPGDVRNCLVALADGSSTLAPLFQHRYREAEFAGHALGNLILAALAERTGRFLDAVELTGRVLGTAGRILPATEEDVRLEASLEDGSRVRGETAIDARRWEIRRVRVRPRDARPAPGVVPAIRDADLVVLGPGSLFTSVVPHLAIEGIAEALRATSARVVLLANLVHERGEPAASDLERHLEVIERHAGAPVVDALVVNDAPLRNGRPAGPAPHSWAAPACRGVPVLRRPLLPPCGAPRHDPGATATAALEAWAELTAGETKREAE